MKMYQLLRCQSENKRLFTCFSILFAVFFLFFFLFYYPCISSGLGTVHYAMGTFDTASPIAKIRILTRLGWGGITWRRGFITGSYGLQDGWTDGRTDGRMDIGAFFAFLRGGLMHVSWIRPVFSRAQGGGRGGRPVAQRIK
ncbi:hypothetical protein J3F84DRAFT_204142 [Trichoderma pleuroticola]